jgi:malate dehydrogenase
MRVVLAGGAGGVGASLAFNLLIGEYEHDVVIVDPRDATARSHVLDLQQVLEQDGRGTVRVGDMSDLAEADVVVISASAPLRPSVSRLEYLDENAAIVGTYADAIAAHGPGWPGVVVIVTNPIDPLVMAFQRRSQLDRRRVIGYSLNDTLRLRTAIAAAIQRPPGSVEAWSLGEHGDAAVPLLSAVRVGGAPATLTDAQRDAALDFARGWYTRHVALDPTRSSTWTSGRGLARVVTALAGGEPLTIPASILLDGEYGLRDVALGVPVTVGPGGVTAVHEWPLHADEAAALRDAATVVAAAAARICPT